MWLCTTLSREWLFLTSHPNLGSLEFSCPIDIPVTEDFLGLLCADSSNTGDQAVQPQIVPSA